MSAGTAFRAAGSVARAGLGRRHCAWQQSATCCNTVQHAATECNMLQQSATCCNMLQHSATCCMRCGICSPCTTLRPWAESPTAYDASRRPCRAGGASKIELVGTSEHHSKGRGGSRPGARARAEQDHCAASNAAGTAGWCCEHSGVEGKLTGYGRL